MRRSIFGGLGLIILGVIAVALYLGVFIVDQTQQALVLRFGQVVRAVKNPGLYYKLPLIDNVVYLDKRVLDLDSPPLEVIASDQKRLVVDAFGRYRIIDPLLFYQSVGSVSVADSRLSVILNSAVRRVLGDATFIQLVRDTRADLMTKITEQVDREARGLGIEVVDVKIRRADLPEANSQAIFGRMRTERQREAADFRAQGSEIAQGIRSRADRDVTVILANAERDAAILRGEGDGEAARIYAEAYGRNPDFFEFYRSMRAYEQAMASSTTTLVIDPSSEFFKYLKRGPTGAR